MILKQLQIVSAILLIATTTWAQTALTDELTVYLPLNGNTKNKAVGNHSLDLYAKTFVNDRYGKNRRAISCNGYDEYGTIKYPKPDELTFAFWMKRETSKQGAWVAGWVGTTQKAGLLIDSKNNYTFEKNQWYHIAVTIGFDNNAKLYVNSKLTEHFTVQPDKYRNFSFGYARGSAYFEGKIDDIFIYERVLNAEEIVAIFHNQLNYEDHEIRNVVPTPNTELTRNIPTMHVTANNTYALIIGNENYSRFQKDKDPGQNVKYANNDALVFKEYATKTFGVPEEQTHLLLDATYGQMITEIDKLNRLAKADKNVSLLFYYAGHGMPDEKNNDGYLVPVDVTPHNLEKSAIRVSDLYASLSENQTKRVTVFLDACYSGALIGDEERAVKAVPVVEESAIKGNMVVFTSSSGTEYSKVYKEKKHGLFTYFLLKKIQDSKGMLSYGELANHLQSEVNKHSLNTFSATQKPQIINANNLGESWKTWSLK